MEDSWRNVLHSFEYGKETPLDFPEVELMRDEWEKPIRCRWNDMHPTTNIADLRWRPALAARPAIG